MSCHMISSFNSWVEFAGCDFDVHEEHNWATPYGKFYAAAKNSLKLHELQGNLFNAWIEFIEFKVELSSQNNEIQKLRGMLFGSLIDALIFEVGVETRKNYYVRNENWDVTLDEMGIEPKEKKYKSSEEKRTQKEQYKLKRKMIDTSYKAAPGIHPTYAKNYVRRKH